MTSVFRSVLVLTCLFVVAKSGQLSLTVDTTAVRFEVQNVFLSVNLDSSLVLDKHFDFNSQRLHTLLSGLTPCLLRVGGSGADYTYFDSPLEKLKQSGLQPVPEVVSKSYLSQLVRLANATGSRLLYDLNLQLRDGVQWSPLNTVELLQFAVAEGLAGLVDFELGNEPDAYSKQGQMRLTGEQIGEDFLMLKHVLNSYGGHFKNTKLVGPDVIGVTGKTGNAILKGFAKVAAHNVTAMTVHQLTLLLQVIHAVMYGKYLHYAGSVTKRFPEVTKVLKTQNEVGYYFRGDQAGWKDYISPKNFPLLADTISSAKGVIASCPNPHLPLWIGETSDSWHSGTANVSDRYVSGFLWLEKLGLSAYMGVGVVMRQTFYGGNYGLMNNNYMPNPDYWLSYIYKKLVGSRVLNRKVSSLTVDDNDDVRVYVQCTKHSSRYGAGAITLYALNVNVSDSTTITVKGELSLQRVDVYLLSPGDKEGLLSKYVSLNGQQLHLMDDKTMPELKPVSQPASIGIKLPALTFTFAVFPDANVKICW